MNFRKTLLLVCSLSLPLLAADALARVHRALPWQSLPTPLNDDPNGPLYAGAGDVAIDGDSIIATFAVGSNQTAVLYRRDDNDNWEQIGTLATGNNPTGYTPQVTMKNNLALIRLDTRLFLFEKSGDSWISRTIQFVPGANAGGYAISGQRIIIGTLDCAAGSDATLLAPNASREWVITGRINGAAGQCNSGPVDLDLNYDYALIRTKSDVVRAYRPNGTAVDWVSAGTFTLPADAGSLTGPVVLQKSTAVAPGASVFRRSGSTWTRGADVVPLNRDDGAGNGGEPLYRDGALLNIDDRYEWRGLSEPDMYVYSETSPGVFAHVGVLGTGEMRAYAKDVSHEWVVAATTEVFGSNALSVWRLREPLVAPEAIADSFQTRDVSGLQMSSGSQFTVAGIGSNQVLRQSNTTTVATAAVAASDWTYYQRISADVTPTSFGSGARGAGLAVRFVDADNYYSVSVRNSNVVQLRRRVDGIETVLDEAALAVNTGVRQSIQLVIEGKQLSADIGDVRLEAEDDALDHGRAALLTDHARADFDNMYVAPTSGFGVFYRGYDGRNQAGPELNYIGGHWEKDTLESTELRQSDTSGTALAHIGVPIRDQSVSASITLNQYAPTSTAVAWFGLMARYTDPQNFYCLSVRSSGQLQIRKVVRGITTVIRSVPYTAVPGTAHRYRLMAIGNELHAFVDDTRVLTEFDPSLATGSYGIVTYRTDASWGTLIVSQP